jgi:glutamyl-tRNA reductase
VTLFCLGLNHRTAPVELREKLTIDTDQLAPSLDALSQHVDQGVILSTCNRTEIYTIGPAESLTHQMREYLSDYSQLPLSRLEPHLYEYQGVDCVRHLFRVSGGLDSMVVGEQQVLNQVRTAFSAASEPSNLRGPFSRLFHQAMRVGRRIHHNTRIGSNYRSVSRVSVQLARRLLGDLSQRRALLIGAGGAGQLVAQSLADLGVGQLSITNRTAWRAEELAKKLGGVTVPFENLTRQLAHTDLVISSTGSPEYVLTRTQVQQALEYREGGPMLFIDIAVPRDIDPEVNQLEGVRLYDIDALQMAAEANSESLEREIAWAEELVERETNAFMNWWQSLDVVPLITSMREQAEAMRQEEVAKTLGRLKTRLDAESLSSEDLFEHLEAMTAALIKKLLHHPTVYLREGNDPSRQQMAQEFYNLNGKQDEKQNRRGGGRGRE